MNYEIKSRVRRKKLAPSLIEENIKIFKNNTFACDVDLKFILLDLSQKELPENAWFISF